MQLFPVLRDAFGGYIAAQLSKRPDADSFSSDDIEAAKFMLDSEPEAFYAVFNVKPNTFRRTRIQKAAYFHIVRRMEKVGCSFEFLDIQKNKVRGFVKEEGIKREFLMSKDENGKWDIVIYVDFVNGIEVEPTTIEDTIRIRSPKMGIPKEKWELIEESLSNAISNHTLENLKEFPIRGLKSSCQISRNKKELKTLKDLKKK